MPMIGTRLGSAMVTNIQAIPGISITNVTELTSFCQAIGKAIVQEIVDNADVQIYAHAGEGLSVAAGTPSSGTDPQGGTVTSAVTTDTAIVGEGSII